MFFNELDILEIRLNELYSHVDGFILVESRETHRGNPKPLYFEESRDRFRSFLPKITHIVIDQSISTQNPWDRENFQRDSIMEGLKKVACSPDDLVMISDVDEVVRGSKIPEIYRYMNLFNFSKIVCEQSLYRFYLNCLDRSCRWAGTCVIKYRDLLQTTPTSLRIQRDAGNGKFAYPVLPHCGWHFTSMGGLERFAYKMEQYAHAEHDTPEHKSLSYVEKEILNCTLLPIDDSFPCYMKENIDFYKEHGYIYSVE